MFKSGELSSDIGAGLTDGISSHLLCGEMDRQGALDQAALEVPEALPNDKQYHGKHDESTETGRSTWRVNFHDVKLTLGRVRVGLLGFWWGFWCRYRLAHDARFSESNCCFRARVRGLLSSVEECDGA